MISIRSSAEMDRALGSQLLDVDLRRLLALRRRQLLEGTRLDLSEVAHLLVVQFGDTLPTVQAEAGVPLSLKEHWFEWSQRHRGGWIETVAMTSDDFTVSLFVPDRPAIDADLLALVRSIT